MRVCVCACACACVGVWGPPILGGGFAVEYVEFDADLDVGADLALH